MSDPFDALDTVRAQAERIMVDTCIITRDLQGKLDDTLNLATLQLDPPAGDTATVYTGRCFVGDDVRGDRRAPDVRTAVAHRYRVRIPVTAPEVKVGDRFVLTTAARSRGLVDKPMKVVDIDGGTAIATRRFTCELVLGERP